MKRELKYLLASILLILAGNFAGKVAYRPSQWLAWPMRAGRRALGLAQVGKEPLAAWRQQCRLELARLQAENQQQRKLLDSGPAKELFFTPVAVVGQRPGILALAAGRDRGLAVGQLVVDSRGLVGKITKVADYRAEVQTPENGDFRLAVAIWSKGEGRRVGNLAAKGLLYGGRNPEVKEIPKEAQLTEGDLVAPLGLGGQFLVGQIVAVASPEGAFRRVRVKPASHLSWLTVFVVKNL